MTRKSKRIRIGIIAVVIIAMIILAIGKRTASAPAVSIAKAETKSWYQPTHQQEVWRYALEWCECRGVKSAVNPNDLDNTPSYYSFQWKPSTFRRYAEKYGVIEKGLSDKDIMLRMQNYETEVLVINEMIGDRANINWSHEFPDCVRKYGPPPSQ